VVPPFGMQLTLQVPERVSFVFRGRGFDSRVRPAGVARGEGLRYSDAADPARGAPVNLIRSYA